MVRLNYEIIHFGLHSYKLKNNKNLKFMPYLLKRITVLSLTKSHKKY